MKEQLTNELIQSLIPYIEASDIDDVRMHITMVLNKYDVSQAERSLIVYEQDETELMLKRFLCVFRSVKRSRKIPVWALRPMNSI